MATTHPGATATSVLEQIARLSVRLTFQSVVEKIVCEELGRERYPRRTAESSEGYRNGWQQPRTLKTSLGPVSLQRPKLRHAHAAPCDRLFGQIVTRTNALETLVISCWVRGVSDRDVEAMMVEVFGPDAGISRTTASRICQRLRAEFDAWRRRDLTKVKLDHAGVLGDPDAVDYERDQGQPGQVLGEQLGQGVLGAGDEPARDR
jgi:putative transposase